MPSADQVPVKTAHSTMQQGIVPLDVEIGEAALLALGR